MISEVGLRSCFSRVPTRAGFPQVTEHRSLKSQYRKLKFKTRSRAQTRKRFAAPGSYRIRAFDFLAESLLMNFRGRPFSDVSP
jgi:hypothetical protein